MCTRTRNFNTWSIQCKLSKFEWLLGEQALNIHEKLCKPYPKTKQKISDLKKENLHLRVKNSILRNKNVELKGTIDWIVYGRE